MSRFQSIAAARRHYSLTQEQLAEKLGVSRSAVAQWEMEEGGTRPDPTHAATLVGLLPGLEWAAIYPMPAASRPGQVA